LIRIYYPQRIVFRLYYIQLVKTNAMQTATAIIPVKAIVSAMID